MVDLQKLVKKKKADIGLAFDGDADRCFLVDETGALVSPSALTALIADRELRKRPGSTIIYNLISSQIVREVVEENETKHFETKVKLESEIKDLDEKYEEVKDKIWKELRESSLKIWEYHKEFKDDDRKLKKQITNEYNSLKNNLEEKLKDFNENSVKTDQVLLNYFETLREEISNLPEVRYYDEDIKHVRKDIKDLYDLVRTIKSEQKDLQESILREPLS